MCLSTLRYICNCPLVCSHLNGMARYAIYLKKLMDGLKQLGLQWYTELSSTLVHLGLSKSEYDHAVFTTNDPINRLVIGVSVDDMLVTGPNINTINRFKAGLANRYDITNLGEAQWFLGFNISWDRS